MLVLEGPDGGGKTTLLNKLERKYPYIPQAPRFSTSVDGPVDNLGLRVMQDMLSWDSRDLHVYDRHPFISELIYGPIVRGEVKGGIDGQEFMGMRSKFMRQSLVILCLPQFDTVVKNIRDNSDDQMSGVVFNIKAIYDKYQTILREWPGELIWYDYELHDISYLFEMVLTHHNSWKETHNV